MTSIEQELLGAFEVHSLEQIRAIVDEGFDPRSLIRGKPLVNWLTEMYLRSDRFPECLKLLLDRGAPIDDSLVIPVLLDDAQALKHALRVDPNLIKHRTDMVSAFTPLLGASLLHVAAEFGSRNAARILIEAGADVNATASVDEFGLNGHTPLFHTVNSILNYSEPIVRLLLDAGAKCDIQLRGITWGKGFEWETTFFDVTPISYAQLGLMPQVHRKDSDVYAIIKRLLRASNRQVPPLENVPNRYLHPKKD